MSGRVGGCGGHEIVNGSHKVVNPAGGGVVGKFLSNLSIPDGVGICCTCGEMYVADSGMVARFFSSRGLTGIRGKGFA